MREKEERKMNGQNEFLRPQESASISEGRTQIKFYE